MKKFSINFEIPFYDDLEPETKTSEDLFMAVLLDIAGKKSSIKKYNDREIKLCVRYLILNGFMRGSVLDFNDCAWSRLSSKGKYLLKLYQEDAEFRFRDS